MGIMDKLKAELIDVIEWLDATQNTLVYRFERFENEIKYGARLVVREGQAAVCINEGKLADVFLPGTYTLDTRNLPVLTTLKGWKYGFSSPFKVEVYFCSTRQFTNLKWGTPGPVTMRDTEFGAVRVSAYGLYSIKLRDPALFIREIVGTDGNFSTASIEDNLRGKIGTCIKEVLPDIGIPVIDLESRVVQLGETLKSRIEQSMAAMGIELAEVQVQDIGLPEEIEKAIDKAGAMRFIGDMQRYTQYETASAIKDAANNPNGLAAAGVGMGMGFGIGGQMASAAGGSLTRHNQNISENPPPLAGSNRIFVAVNKQQTGPFEVDELSKMIQTGQLTRSTLVWKKGLPSWVTAEQLPELADILNSAPPPLTSA